jgi:PAS domain S-box/diguanylate cyclase (GGDEF) domain
MKAKMEEEKYRVIAEISNDILFEYDIKSDTMCHAEKFREIFGRTPDVYRYTEDGEELQYIHEEDKSVFENYCNLLHGQKQIVEAEFRIMDANGQYVWCHVRGKTIYNGNNVPIKIIGKIVNIDIQKKELDKLQFKAQMDPLTNVYNKIVTKEKINQYLRDSSPEDQHALMVIDIDDFKQINDSYGHLQGDKVLSAAVTHIKYMFREEDVVGRVGGDEFVVFMNHVTSTEDIAKKAIHLEHAFQNSCREDDEKIEVSGSIGIAIYPKDGATYDELFEKADKALYDVKLKGKNNYSFYIE